MKAVQPNLKMEAKKTRRAVTQWLRLTTQSRLGQKPSQLFILKNFDLKPCPVFHSQEEWVKTLLSFTFSKDVCQKSREPAQVSQLTVTVPGIVGQYQTGDKIHLKELKNSLTPGEEWVGGGVEGLQLVSLQRNPPEGGLRQGTRFNPEIGCFHKVLQPMSIP